MKAMIKAAAKKFGVPSEVLDLIGRGFISHLVDEWPDLLLPPIMQTLHREYLNHGIDWIRQNVRSLQDQFLLLKKLYGPTWILT